MGKPISIVGRIFSHAGTSPGPASGITYTIALYTDDGGVTELPAQKPGIERWDDSVDVVAVAAGTPVHGWKESDTFYFWNFRELLAPGYCGGQAPPPGMVTTPGTFPPTRSGAPVGVTSTTPGPQAGAT